MNPLVSILIPFYNEEKNILKALESCLNQSYGNIEIILVDDFSTDSSVENIKVVTDSRVKILQSINKGVGFARNTALKAAKGEFFAFLDADDELDKEFVSISLKEIQEKKCDIAVFGSKVFDRNKNEIGNATNTSKFEVLSGTDALKMLYSHSVIASVWAKLFRTSLAKDTEFEVDFVFEDKPFMTELFLTANQVYVGQTKLYLHFANPNSITRSKLKEKRIRDSTTSFFVEQSLLTSHGATREIVLLSFNYQINIMVDIFLMLWLDRKLIDSKKLLTVFVDDLKRIIDRSEELSLDFSLKRKLLFTIMKSSKQIGMSIPVLIVKTYFKSQYRFIKKIKA